MGVRKAAVDRLQCLFKVSGYITSNHILPVMHQEMGIICFFKTAEEIEPETAHFTDLHPTVNIQDGEGGSDIGHGEDITRFVHHVEEGVVIETTVDVGIKRGVLSKTQLQRHIGDYTYPCLVASLKQDIHTQAGIAVQTTEP